MTFKQKILYFLCSLGILVIFALFDFFVLKHVVDFFSTSWQVHLIVYIVLLLLVNPFIALFIVNKIPFEVKGLKVNKGINEALKKESLQ